MSADNEIHCIAFDGVRAIATGTLSQVALRVREAAEGREGRVLVFDQRTSHPIELDLRGTEEEVLERLGVPETGGGAPPRRRPGRPKLGVVSREVTLLPRHWEWLNAQPGGASVTLRKLVERARRDPTGEDRLRRAQESAYRFLSAMAGNEPGFEEATRALFAGDPEKFDREAEPWPIDVREHAKKLAAVAFDAASGGASRPAASGGREGSPAAHHDL